MHRNTVAKFERPRSYHQVLGRYEYKCKSLVVLKKNNYLLIADVDTEITNRLSRNEPGRTEKDSGKSSGVNRRIEKPSWQLAQGTFSVEYEASSRVLQIAKNIHKVNDPAYSVFLERVLHQLLRFVPANIKNTAAATRSLEKPFFKTRGSPGQCEQAIAIVCTMDVVVVYPSILIEEGIEAVLVTLEEHKEENDTAGISQDEIKSFLVLVLHNNFFKFAEVVK